MKKQTKIILVILFVLVGVFYLSKRETVNISQESSSLNSQPVEKSEVVKDFPDLMMDYTPENLKIAQEKGRTVLFFHALWCSTCKAATRDIITNEDKLPKDLSILRLDYDKEIKLKRKYGIFTQHTFVQIDENSDEVKKWVGGGVRTINTNLE